MKESVLNLKEKNLNTCVPTFKLPTSTNTVLRLTR